jgi:protein MAK16
LRSGAYGDRPLNVEEAVWKKVMRSLERGGEGVRDEDLDEGIEEEDEAEREYEYEEEGVGQVEYVSDVDSESEEDVGDLEDWVGGESADEEEDSKEDVTDEDEEGESDEDGEEEEDDEKLKKALASLKRKRPVGKPPKPNKKSSKGPKQEIEYEIEKEQPPRQMLEV